jgi:hypothetical protein
MLKRDMLEVEMGSNLEPELVPLPFQKISLLIGEM